MINPKGEGAGTKVHMLYRRLAFYMDALNEIDDYFEYRCESKEDRAHVFEILTTLATKLRVESGWVTKEEHDEQFPATDD